MDSVFLAAVKAFADTLVDGTVEFSGNQIAIYGIVSYDKIPTMQRTIELFGNSKVAIMSYPMAGSEWRVCVACIGGSESFWRSN